MSNSKKPSEIQPPAVPKGGRKRKTRRQRLQLMEATAKLPLTKLELSVQHQAALRREAYLTVLDELQTASDVLSGKEVWNANQVRLFGMLLNKVMPDLKYSKSEVDHNYNTSPETLSREQLEALVIDAQSVTNADEDN